MIGAADGGVTAGAIAAASAGLAGLGVPILVRRLPPPASADGERASYSQLASWPPLPWLAVAFGVLLGGTWGLWLGWDPALIWLLPLVPLGVALGYVDLRIRLLPTRLIAPAYGWVAIAVLATGLIQGDPDRIVRAVVGWLAVGGLFGVLWWTSAGMGYGDVRLSGVLGMALAAVGWAELLVGVYAGFLVGVLGWVVLRILGVVRGRSFPFGPALLVGAWLGVLAGPTVIGLVTNR